MESGATIGGPKIFLRPDLEVSDLRASDYSGVIVPCMTAGLPRRMTDGAVPVVKTIAVLGRPIAAQNGGVCLLDRAGLMVGRKHGMQSRLLATGDYIELLSRQKQK